LKFMLKVQNSDLRILILACISKKDGDFMNG
jgi:hypothetical protein